MEKEDRDRLIVIETDMKHLTETFHQHVEDDKTTHKEVTAEIKAISTKITLILGGLIVISTLINFLK